jgi:hypothetical protein
MNFNICILLDLTQSDGRRASDNLSYVIHAIPSVYRNFIKKDKNKLFLEVVRNFNKEQDTRFFSNPRYRPTWP